MIFFLGVVLIGTLYPVFLDTITGSKISVGPPYYNLSFSTFFDTTFIFDDIRTKL